MITLNERHVDVDNAAWPQDPMQLLDGPVRIAYVLECAGTEDAVKRGVGNWQSVNVANDVHLGVHERVDGNDFLGDPSSAGTHVAHPRVLRNHLQGARNLVSRHEGCAGQIAKNAGKFPAHRDSENS